MKTNGWGLGFLVGLLVFVLPGHSAVGADPTPGRWVVNRLPGISIASTDAGAISPSLDGCTVGVASGQVTVDGRPLLWKLRDVWGRQQVVHVPSESVPYSYIGVGTVGDWWPAGGLSITGAAIGNSAVWTFDNESLDNFGPMNDVLANCAGLTEIEDYWISAVATGRCTASGCFPFIDAQGNAALFEVETLDWLGVYDTVNSRREAQGLFGFVVRANEFHRSESGADSQWIGGRYASGTYNVAGLVRSHNLSVRTLIEGDEGPNRGYEFVRYGPGRLLASIVQDDNASTLVVHGVAPGEDPALATMWVILGPANFGIAVPAWASVTDIPECLTSGAMYDRAASLWLDANEVSIQAAIFPLEAHLFHVVLDTLLPRWRAEGVPSVAEMTRIEHQLANDAYSLMYCLDTQWDNNQAPEVDFDMRCEGLMFQFTLTAHDSDGVVAAVHWDFGDNSTSAEPSPTHAYASPGLYLISCTVTDDDGVSSTEYKYSAPLP